MNPYADILQRNAHKLLNCFERDPSSGNLGLGDRLYWGWKVIDFPNSTLQGGVHTLAVMVKLGLVENEAQVLRIIDQGIRAVKAHGNQQGSQQEAYPSEHSFCVTALVAFDVLSAMQHLEGRISQQQRSEYLDIVRPLIDFITRNGEEHAIISNHLATGVAAVALWNQQTGENNNRWRELLSIITHHQSTEGWHKEYEGADPGYNTLGIYYLSAAYLATKDEALLDSIRKAGSFLVHFVHPDHTIGGLYGSRNTEVYYPGGMVALASQLPDLAQIAKHLQTGIEHGRHLTPENIDIGNYGPLLNAYAHAAAHYAENATAIEQASETLKCSTSYEKDFTEAGIFIKSTGIYHAIVNYKKGGTLKVFDKSTGRIDCEDGGLVAEGQGGKVVSTQTHDPAIGFGDRTIKTSFYELNKSANPTPFTTVVLRVFSLTIFRSVALGNRFKKFIVNMLMTGKKPIPVRVTRAFSFDDNSITVAETTHGSGVKKVRHIGKFKSIHMASAGYYMQQESELPERSEIVTFKLASHA